MNLPSIIGPPTARIIAPAIPPNKLFTEEIPQKKPITAKNVIIFINPYTFVKFFI